MQMIDDVSRLQQLDQQSINPSIKYDKMRKACLSWPKTPLQRTVLCSEVRTVLRYYTKRYGDLMQCMPYCLC